MTLLLLASLRAARAQEPEAAALLHDAMLLEALQGDLEQAILTYRSLVRSLPDEEPARVEALYRLGHALADLGRADEAREAYREGVRGGACPRCMEALEELEIERHAVAALPTVWTFDDASHGVFHPSEAQALGSIRIGQAPDGRSALAWEILPRPVSEDHLVFALGAGARALVLVARPEEAAGALELVVEDGRGRRYATREPLRFPGGSWTQVEVDLRALAPLEEGGPPPDPTRLVRVELADRSGFRRGAVLTWWIDRIEVR